MKRTRAVLLCVTTLAILAFLTGGFAEAQYKLSPAYEKGPPYEKYEAFPEAPAKGAPVNITVGYQTYYTQSWSSVAVNGLKLWKKFLPAGSDVSFSLGLQGAIITNAMLGGKSEIGYTGDMPHIVSTTKRDIKDIRIVSVQGYSEIGGQCNSIHVRPDAPQFKDAKEAIRWLDGKIVALPKGSCTHRFTEEVLKEANIKPKELLNQNIEVMLTNFRAGKLDAGVIWENTASQIDCYVSECVTRRVSTGKGWKGGDDAAHLGFVKEWYEKNWEAAVGFIKADIEGQLYTLDPKNQVELTRMSMQQSTGRDPVAMWFSHYGRIPDEAGGGEFRDCRDLVFTPRYKALYLRAHKFLYDIKVIAMAEPFPDAWDDRLVNQAIKELGLKVDPQRGLGCVKATPLDKMPKEIPMMRPEFGFKPGPKTKKYVVGGKEY